ncbi:MAG: substrate-binding domain-containing protein [Zoogloeaceae bacterium]|nr:substrate-binding domain-containing protein [Zoogloeaceae bacterium]
MLHDDPDHPEFLEEHWRIEEDYAPFSRQSRLVSPGTPPSLQIDRDYPRLDGAVAFFPVYAAIANAIYKDKEGNGDRKESVGFSATSPEAYTALLEGRVDMIFALVPSVEQEQEAAAQGLTFILTPIAREAFVFLVNEQNPVKNLAVEQIRAIYSGQINNWREVGGPSGKIMAFQRNAGSGSQTTMLRHVMRGTPMRKPLKGEYFSGMGGIIRRVADYRNLDHALGYSFRFYATTLNSIPGIRLLAVDGVLPNVENIRDGSYPFTVDIYIVTARPLSENAQKLRDWLLSAEGQQLIADVGYTPLASDVR